MNVQKKDEYSYVEIYGAETVLNLALSAQFGIDYKEELFVAGGLMNSTSDANGGAIEFEEGVKFSHCGLLDNGMLVGVCYDKDENESFWRIEPSNITKLDIS